jgi:hypothetical protein
MVNVVSSKSFDFISESTETEVASVKKATTLGEWMTHLQLCKELGGVDQPEAVRQAEHYRDFCQNPELKD